MGHARFSEPNRWLYDVTAKDDAEVYVHYVDAGSVNQRSLGLVPDQSSSASNPGAFASISAISGIPAAIFGTSSAT